MPRKKTRKEEKSRTSPVPTLWEIMSNYLMNQATRLERDLPWLLDKNKGEYKDFKENKDQKYSTNKHVNTLRASNFEDQTKKIGECVH